MKTNLKNIHVMNLSLNGTNLSVNSQNSSLNDKNLSLIKHIMITVAKLEETIKFRLLLDVEKKDVTGAITHFQVIS
ncbi:hypothetical protein ACOBWA_01195 [Psychrobacter sp. ER1]|uniref:hypothetical protein n=1 Tax=Psychrobacter sp. ER1 TaxID=3406645 RepID=UPI003B434A3F